MRVECWKRGYQSWRNDSPGRKFRVHHTGAVIGSNRSVSSSGRAGPIVCMIVFVTPARANRGGSIASPPKTASAVAAALCRRLGKRPVEILEIKAYVSVAQTKALNSAAIAAGG